MRIKNNSGSSLTTSIGVTLEPGHEVFISDAMWDWLQQDEVVNLWLRAGVLSQDGVVLTPPGSAPPASDTTAPTITSTASHNVNENAVYSATATANETVTWAKGGADASLVTLNTSTGAWSVAAQDFEAKTSVSFTLTATDTAGNVSSPQTVTLTINNLDEIAPTITSSASPSVVENSAFSLNLTANETVTWSLNGGADQSAFTLVGSTLSMAAKDFETPVDANANNTYVVTVRAVDAANNGTNQTITVTVTDVADTGPVAPTVTWDTDSAVAEPTFTVESVSPQVGDVITFQIDTSSSFASATGTDATVDGGSVASGFVQFTLSTLANGTYYTRSKVTRGGTDSAWSVTVPVTIAAVVDSTAPTLSSATGTQTGSTTATVSATTNEANGTLYAFVSTASSPPTAAALKAGTGAVYAASQTITTTGAKTFSATGLTASTAYYAHLLHRDAAGNDSTIISSASFTTAASAGALPTFGAAAYGGGATLTNANRTASFTTSGADKTERTTESISGKKYFAITMTSASNSAVGIGVLGGTTDVASIGESGSHAAAANGFGQTKVNGVGVWGVGISTGTTVGVLIDTAAAKMWVTDDGVNHRGGSNGFASVSDVAAGTGGTDISTITALGTLYGVVGTVSDGTYVFDIVSYPWTTPSGFTAL